MRTRALFLFPLLCPLLFPLALPSVLILTSKHAAAADAELQIRDLQDLDFGLVPPTVGTLTADSDFCVPMVPRSRYSLIGFGNGSNGAFSLVDPGNTAHTIDYRVRISDRGRGNGDELFANTPLPGLRASNFLPNGRCNPRGLIRVIIEGSEIQSAAPGSYDGTLTLTVVPE